MICIILLEVPLPCFSSKLDLDSITVQVEGVGQETISFRPYQNEEEVAKSFVERFHLEDEFCVGGDCVSSIIAEHLKAKRKQRHKAYEVKTGVTYDEVTAALENSETVVVPGKRNKRGLVYMLPMSDNFIASLLICEGTFEEPSLRLLEQLLVPGDIVVDAGANLGSYALPFALAVAPHGRVFAIEPQPLVAQYLGASAALSSRSGETPSHKRVSEVLRIVQAAAVREVGRDVAIPRVDYEATRNFGAFSMHGFDDGDDPLLVISTTVDRVLGFDDEKSGVPNYSRDGDSLPRCPRLIKIDVENYEEEVLGGSTRVLSDCAARGSPPFLFMENLAFQPRHLPSGVMRNYIPYFTSISV